MQNKLFKQTVEEIIDVEYTMENIYSESARVIVFTDGTAAVVTFDYDLGIDVAEGFPSEDAAYNWCYKNGFRE